MVKVWGSFKSTRGLRQGDPLSPTLFVIAAECLSRGLELLYQQQPRLTFLSKSNLPISHLAFADDIVIFSKGTRRELKILMDFLKQYEQMSGQRINREKSSFTVDKKTPALRVRCIQNVTGFRLKLLPITYLGAPIFKGNKKGILFDDLIQKIRNKITGWEKALLSHGRTTSTHKKCPQCDADIPSPSAETPKYVMERIERIFNKFFWGHLGDQRKLIWSSWDSICYPTEEGGFGVRRIQDVVQSFQLKMWWRFRNQNSLWSHFLLDKYCKGSHPVTVKPSYIASANWKRMCRNRKEAENHLFWSIGKGELSFWFDNWIGDKPLYEILPEHTWNSSPVNAYWENNSWNNSKLQEILPANVVHQISQIPFEADTIDAPVWKLSSSGNFNMKATWNSLRQTRTLQQLSKEIWSPLITPTMSIFIWRLITNKIPVDEKLQEKGFQLASKCTCCDHTESLRHLFIDGTGISRVWEYFAKKLNMNLPRTDNIVLLLNYWRISALGANHIRMILPMLILWFGWLERNDVKHRNKKFNPERIIWKVHQHIVTISKTKIAKGLNWKGDRHFAKSIGLDIGSSYKPKLKIVKWTKPEAGWIKINTDGASKGNPGVAGAGGIARNEEGAVIFAFYETLGEANNSFAEVFGLFKALQICQTEGLPRVWIEVDANCIIHLIQKSATAHWSMKHMLTHIHLMLKRVEFKITHIYREGNRAADFLANLACSTNSSQLLRGRIFKDNSGGSLSVTVKEFPTSEPNKITRFSGSTSIHVLLLTLIMSLIISVEDSFGCLSWWME
ncbi:UNVERIFIED_CONTAM: putative ribonuclease H protein [Sesamum radiatum]|uniref:Ribonuclease H protein n=1 Tax=Sesamum radiatum TaxID=300843 RepID=A0AAW2JCN2_SESRA